MKLSLAFLTVSGLAITHAHGPDEGTMATSQAPAVNLAPPANFSKPAIPLKAPTTTPAGCLKLSTDKDWPTAAEWKSALPRALPRAKNLAAGLIRPDYHFVALNVADVQAAVNFCAKHSIRLTIINSGHVSRSAKWGLDGYTSMT
jgi:hypothetical protein